MSSNANDSGSSDSVNSRIEALGDLFLNDLRGGSHPDWRVIVADNPELAPGLEERLKLLETVYRAGKFLSQTPRPPTVHDTVTQQTDDESFELPNPASPSKFETADGRDPYLPLYQHRAKRIRCPHCGNPVQLVDTHVTEVTCASCGSAVDVDPEETRTDQTIEIPPYVNRFKIKRLLGRGGFGVVYLAHDPRLDRDVAIKIPRQGYFVTREEEQRFFREAKAAARLSHEGIVPIHEVSVFGEAPFIVSEFIDGMTLSDLVSGSRLSFREIATLVVQICDAVEHAHQHNVIHRDLKPSNILLDQERRPHVADFGLARWDHAEMTMTIDGAVLGTPAYMSPEQAAGRHSEIDAKSDVYSLGVILYRLLCCELPFTGSRRMMIYQVLHDEPANPSFFNREIPRDLETITLKAMAKSSSDRYSSAQALGDELQRWLDRRPIQARPIGRMKKCLRWCRRNPTEAALIVTVASFLIAAAIFFWIKANSETQLRRIADNHARQAIKNQQQSDQRLFQIYEQNGINALDKNRMVDAAYWFGKSITVDDQPRHRLRLALVADQMPKLLQLLPTYDSPVKAIQFSRDGQKIAIRTRDAVRVFLTDSGQQLFERINPDPGLQLEFFDERQLIAFGIGPNRVEVWDPQSSSLEFEIETGEAISHLVASPIGDQLAVCLKNGHVDFWDSSGLRISQLPTENLLFSRFEYLGAGQRVLTQSIDTKRAMSVVRVFDSNSKELDFELEFPGQLVIDVSADGTRLATISQGQTLQFFDLETGQPIGNEIDTEGNASRIMFNASGDRVHLLLDSKVLSQRDVLTGQLIGNSIRVNAMSSLLTVSDDRQFVSVKDAAGEDAFYQLETSVEVASRLKNRLVSRHNKFHPNGHAIAIECDDGWVRLWDLAGSTPNYLELLHDAGVRDAQFLPGTERCVTISRDQNASLWNIETGSKIADMDHDAEVLELDVQPDGRLIATGAGDQVRLWNGLTGVPVGSPFPHSSLVNEIHFSSDGQKLLAGCLDGTIRCWEIGPAGLEDPLPLFEVTHPDQILSLAINTAGNHFAATSFDGTMNVFDLRNGRLVTGPHRHRRPCRACLFLEGERVAVACGREIEIWNTAAGTKVDTLTVEAAVLKLLLMNSGNTKWLVGTDVSGTSIIWELDGDQFILKTQYREPAFADGGYSNLTFDHQLAAISGGSFSDLDQRGGVRVFDPTNAKPIGPLLKHRGFVSRVYFDRGQRLMSASQDGTARIWPLQPFDLPKEDMLAWLSLHVESDDKELPDISSQFFRDLAGRYPQLFRIQEHELRQWNRLVEADD